MQAQEQRDEKSIRIFTGLLLGVLLTLGGMFLLWVVNEAFALDGLSGGDLPGFLMGGGVLLALAYVARHRRP